MNKQHAKQIAILIVKAGWVDDADELLRDSESSFAARQKAVEIDELVALINPFLDRPLRVDALLIWEGIEHGVA